MSFLRRRILGEHSSSSSKTKLKRGESPITTEEVRLVPISKIRSERGHKRRNGFIFVLGGLFGLLVAAFFANRHDVINLDEWLAELNLENLVDVIPAGILRDAKDIQV